MCVAICCPLKSLGRFRRSCGSTICPPLRQTNKNFNRILPPCQPRFLEAKLYESLVESTHCTWERHPWHLFSPMFGSPLQGQNGQGQKRQRNRPHPTTPRPQQTRQPENCGNKLHESLQHVAGSFTSGSTHTISSRRCPHQLKEGPLPALFASPSAD